MNIKPYWALGSWPWKFKLGPLETQFILMIKSYPGSFGDSSRSHRPPPTPWHESRVGGAALVTEVEGVAIIETPSLTSIPCWHFSTGLGWHPWLIRMLCQNNFFIKKERFLPKQQSISSRALWGRTGSEWTLSRESAYWLLETWGWGRPGCWGISWSKFSALRSMLKTPLWDGGKEAWSLKIHSNPEGGKGLSQGPTAFWEGRAVTILFMSVAL